MDGDVAKVLWIAGCCIGERRFHPLVNPDVSAKLLANRVVTLGRLDDVPSNKWGPFGSVDNGYGMARHLENKKASASLQRMLVDCAHTGQRSKQLRLAVSVGVEALRAERRLSIGGGDELVEISYIAR